jgi:UDP-galactopyranose mutase
MDLVVIGAGLFGLTIAERAAESGRKVLLIEKRKFIGGNAYSYFDEVTGIEVHKYGSHLFHTSNANVWEYVNRFTEFNNYVHKVFTLHNNRVFSMPINLHTINMFFEKFLSPVEAESLIKSQREDTAESKLKSLEEKAISLIGKPLYDAFIKGYTAKQWQTPPSELPADIISRLPVRFNYRNDYFDDRWQGLPLDGYQAWFNRMVDHKNIEILTGVDFLAGEGQYSKKRIVGRVPVVFCGAIDRYFDYEFGMLGWRTLDFQTTVLNVPDFQGTSVMNFSDETYPYTRIHEFRHLHPERAERYSTSSTVISKEFSRFADEEDEPYYPINSESDSTKLKLYRTLMKETNSVFFGGRLGSYKYLDMHMAVASALSMWNNELEGLRI